MSLQDSQTGVRILAVDDIPDNLFLVQALLESEGYEVKLVTDGETALKEVKQLPPSLILLDVMMPEIDGYEVTRRIRNIPDNNYIPILLVTAFDDASVVEGLDAGADDFIRKPFDTDELLARVRSLLRLKHSIDAQNKMAREREDFVSRLTHDLRTPLVAADRMLNLFLQETFCKISPDMKKAIAAMIRSNNNLLEMVNTLLEVSRIEAGKKTMNFESCSMHSIVEEVVQELSPLAQERDLIKSVQICECSLKIRISINARSLHQSIQKEYKKRIGQSSIGGGTSAKKIVNYFELSNICDRLVWNKYSILGTACKGFSIQTAGEKETNGIILKFGYERLKNPSSDCC